MATTAQASASVYGGDFAGGRGVDLFATAVRAGYTSSSASPPSSPSSIGFTPAQALAGLNAFLAQYWGANLLAFAPGGGIENTGMARGVNEMLLQSYRVAPATLPATYVLSLFPFWPTGEPSSFSSLLAKGGFTVSAAYDNVTATVRSPVEITAAYTISGAASSRCSLLSPWPAAIVAVSCAGARVPVSQPSPGIVAFDAPLGVLCLVSNTA